MIRIVLAENHNVVRQGLKSLLAAQADFEVLGEAADGIEAIQLVEEHEPEILLLDWMLPKLNGLEVVRRLQQKDLRTRVVVLSMHAEESYVIRAMKHGALGYVLKDSSGTELIEAIRTCQRGERYLSSQFSADRLQEFEQKMDTGKLDPIQALTDREREIMLMVAEGLTSPQIADQLSISRRTVEAHRSNFMRKLDLSSTHEVTKFALRRGLISVTQ